VSGYLQRLVARHVGPPAVRVRAVSRFEGDLVGGSVPPEALVAAGQATAPALDRDLPAAPLGPTDPVSATRPAAPAVGRTAPVRSIELPREETAAPAAPLHANPASSREHTDGPPDQQGHVEPPKAVQRDVQPVTPVAIRRSDPPDIATPSPEIDARSPGVAGPSNVNVATARRSEAALTSPEPDVVHVHIGRVEVRAIVPERETSRPTPRTAASPARPAPLSLERYLAGERRS
jgi:hypothetical protein